MSLAYISLGSPTSGSMTVSASGVSVALADYRQVNCPVMLKAFPGNTGTIYIGNVSGSVTATNGMPLSSGEAMVYSFVGNLSDIYVNSSVNGDKVAWAVLQV